MISYKEALNIINSLSITPVGEELTPLKYGLNRILSKKIVSPIHMPPFNQSAMDGYAVHFDEITNKNFKLVGEVAAGDDASGMVLNKGEAVRIFTGAMVPDTANAVIMQEKVDITDTHITINEHLENGKNIRLIGEQIKKGDLALNEGTQLNAAAIGYLKGLGITEVYVYKQPKIAIIVTGNELIDNDDKLTPGKIFESNGWMIENALKALHFNQINHFKLPDNYNQTKSLIATLSSEFDVMLFSGGISVGDYDFVGKSLTDLKSEQYFYKINQKPGKPLFFGKLNNAYIFGLPGNPAASLNSLYIYVYPLLNKFFNLNKQLPVIKLPVINNYTKKDSKTHFLKATINADMQIEILDAQSSAMLKSFALANCLAIVPEQAKSILPNDVLEAFLLPF
ncbi:MAG: molybdopterin molybdotransferase MoeA [Vicingaceae bacterium]